MGKKVSECLEDYNSANKIHMDFVLFTTFIQPVCRVQRVMKLLMGNVLVVGVGDSGRKSIMTLSIYGAQFELFQIEISQGYGMDECHDDMKRWLMRCGCDDTSVTFLFLDTRIATEAFLEEVSSILNTGEVPNLYADEDGIEIGELCSKAVGAIRKTGLAEIFAFYIDTCRKNPHVLEVTHQAYCRRRWSMFYKLVPFAGEITDVSGKSPRSSVSPACRLTPYGEGSAAT